VSSESEGRLVKASTYYPGLGWKVLPCHGVDNGRCTCGKVHGEPKEVGKHPVLNQWNTESTSDIDKINRWWSENPQYNIGVHCSKSGFLVIDIDPRSGGPDSFLDFEKLVDGELPPTVEALTGNYTGKDGRGERGRHIFYKCDPDEGLIGNLNNLGLKGVDIKHNGYVLISPSRHFSGVTYDWKPGHAPWEIDMVEAPEALLEVLRKRQRRGSYNLGVADWDWIKDVKNVDYAKVLEQGIDEGSRAVTVYELGCHLANKLGTDAVSAMSIETMMIRFNAEKIRPPMDLEGSNSLLQHVRRAIDFVHNNPKSALINPEAAAWQKERAAKISQPAQGVKVVAPMLGVVQPAMYTEGESDHYVPYSNVSELLENGDSISEATTISRMDVPKDPDALDIQDGGTPGARSLSDTGNGRRLVDIFGAGIRYTPGLGWFVWKDGYWKPDAEDLEVRELSKRLTPYIASESGNHQNVSDEEIHKWAKQSRSNSRLAGAVESGKSDPRSLIDVDVWDQGANLLGVLNGVIDLKSGELLKGRPDLHITRRAPVTYTSGHRNARWDAFLEFATYGDKEYAEWLQKAAGYTLTGSSKYDIMFLVYGAAGTGKNTFVEALVKCLGSSQYAWPLDSTILAQGDGNSNSTDLYHWAQLRGRRMVWVDELPESERIKENAVKKLTGSSEISARSPGEQPFTFASQAKLWISTNHRPIITDDAMWRRIRPIPFDRVPETSDPGLKEYIFDPEGALPAVLSWAVEGAMKILNSKEPDALGWCNRVREAADIYRKNEDRIGIFLHEELVAGAAEHTTMKTVFSVYRVWAEDRGERPMTQIAFTRKLNERGIIIEGTGSQAIVRGYNVVSRLQSASTGSNWEVLSRMAR
jgi:putative DNA primase/helicase